MSGADGFKPSDTISLDSSVELPGDSGQFDLTTYTVALAFNSVALPPGMSEAMKAAVAAKATDIREQIRAAAPLDDTSDAGARDKRRKDADERAETQVGIILQVQQRERDEWAQTSHSFAGQNLTGTQWREIAEDLKGGSAGHGWLLAYLIQHGKTPEEADRLASDMELAASGMSKPDDDRTKDERAAMQRVEADPETAATLKAYKDAKAHDFPPVSKESAAFMNSDRERSTGARADALADGFATAPELREHHRAALTATTPLDTSRIAQPAIQPPSQQTAMTAGLDI